MGPRDVCGALRVMDWTLPWRRIRLKLPGMVPEHSQILSFPPEALLPGARPSRIPEFSTRLRSHERNSKSLEKWVEGR